ncbi:MAG: exosortase/archaeosortase family protein [Verrucomicrobiota bacterium]|nr:exosortase/archaeosortase family protein [Verrucomicrobiota bacterium]
MNTALAPAPPAVPTAPISDRRNWLTLAAFGLLWLELISRLRFEWTINPQYGYGWTVPFLAGYIFWRRLQNAPGADAPKTKLLPWLVILGAVMLVMPVRLVQEAHPDWRMLSWAMAFAAVGASLAGVYLAGGMRWLRHFAFPILFFLVAVPWPTQFEQLVIQTLMRAVASINVEVLNAIGISAVQMGNVIEVRTGFVGIDEACTGVRSLQATFMVSLFLGEFYNFKLARRIILIVAGAVLAFVCNLIRTFLLVYVGAEQGAEAIHKWHDPAGHTILMACLLGLWGVSMWLGGATKTAASPHRPESRSAFRLPAILLILIIAFTVAAEAGTQAWYGVHEARAARLEPWSITWPKQAKNWKEIPVADQAQELLRYNEGGGGAWSSTEGKQWAMYFFKWLPGRTAGLFIKNHRPDICLPASGMTLRGGVHQKVISVNGVGLPIRSYVFEKGSAVLHVYYCYWDGSAPEVKAQDQENWTASGRLDAVWRGKRDVGTQMLELVVVGYDTEEQAERAVREQLAQIVHHA